MDEFLSVNVKSIYQLDIADDQLDKMEKTYLRMMKFIFLCLIKKIMKEMMLILFLMIPVFL